MMAVGANPRLLGVFEGMTTTLIARTFVHVPQFAFKMQTPDISVLFITTFRPLVSRPLFL